MILLLICNMSYIEILWDVFLNAFLFSVFLKYLNHKLLENMKFVQLFANITPIVGVVDQHWNLLKFIFLQRVNIFNTKRPSYS